MNNTTKTDALERTPFGDGNAARTAFVQLCRELESENTRLRGPDVIDAITNMIDENIRKGRCGTYDEWQAEVVRVLRG